MKATKRIEMEIAADVQTKICNGIGGEPQGLCRQKISHDMLTGNRPQKFVDTTLTE